jgi:hypothetical protein
MQALSRLSRYEQHFDVVRNLQASPQSLPLDVCLPVEATAEGLPGSPLPTTTAAGQRQDTALAQAVKATFAVALSLYRIFAAQDPVVRQYEIWCASIICQALVQTHMHTPEATHAAHGMQQVAGPDCSMRCPGVKMVSLAPQHPCHLPFILSAPFWLLLAQAA